MSLKIRGGRFKNVLPYLLSSFGFLLGIVLNFILARVLGAEQYGEIQYSLSIAMTFSSIIIFGLTWYVIREAKNDKHQGQLMNKAFSLMFTITIFVLPILYHIITNYLGYGVTSLTVSILITAVVMSINSLGSSYFQGMGKYSITLIIDNIVPKLFILIVTIIFMALSQMDLFQKLYINFYLLIYGVVAIIILKLTYKKINLKFSKNELISISFFFGVTITYSLTTNLMKVFQGSLYDDKVALAIISISLILVGFINIFTNVIMNIAKPLFARLRRENNENELINAYRFITRVTCYISVPFYIFLLTQGQNFLYIFGKSYLQYPTIIILLSAKAFVADISGPNGTMLSMIGKEKWELFNGIVNLISFVLFAYIFSNDIIYGLCYALLFSTLLVNILKYIETWILFKQNPLDIKTITTLIIVFCVDFCAIFFLRNIDNWILWLIVGIVVGIITIGTNFLITLYRDDFRNLIHLKL
jgi:O-antigen/teichoic acid export membrane protein